jgi:hypothetical protein
MKILTLISMLFFGGLSGALAEVQQTEVSWSGQHQLRLRGTKLNVSVKAGAPGKNDKLIVRLNPQNFVIDNKDGVITITEKEFQSEAAVLAASSNVELEAVGGAMDIFSRELKISSSRWNGRLKIVANLVKGSIEKLAGEVNVSATKQELFIDGLMGQLASEGQAVKNTVKSSAFDGEISFLNGEWICEKSKGNLRVSSFSGSLKTNACGGSWFIDNLKGNSSLVLWDGRVEAVSTEGHFAVQVANEADVQIKTQSGRVTLTPAAGAASLLNLLTMNGELVPPAYLKVAREGDKRILRGRTKGLVDKGSFTVRSQDGAIILK